MSEPAKHLLAEIEDFLARNPTMTKTGFGKLANGDPNLVSDLQAGREPRWATAQKIRAAMAPPQSPAPGVEPPPRSAGPPTPSREGAQVASPGTFAAGDVRP